MLAIRERAYRCYFAESGLIVPIQVYIGAVIVIGVILFLFSRDLAKLLRLLRGSSRTYYRKVTGNPEQDQIVYSTDENLRDFESCRKLGIKGSVIEVTYTRFRRPVSRIIGPASKNWKIVLRNATSYDPQIFFSDRNPVTKAEALSVIKDFGGIGGMLQRISCFEADADLLRKKNQDLEEKAAVRHAQILHAVAGLEALWRISTTQRRPRTIQENIRRFQLLLQARISEESGQDPIKPVELAVERWTEAIKGRSRAPKKPPVVPARRSK